MLFQAAEWKLPLLQSLAINDAIMIAAVPRFEWRVNKSAQRALMAVIPFSMRPIPGDLAIKRKNTLTRQNPF